MHTQPFSDSELVGKERTQFRTPEPKGPQELVDPVGAIAACLLCARVSRHQTGRWLFKHPKTSNPIHEGNNYKCPAGAGHKSTGNSVHVSSMNTQSSPPHNWHQYLPDGQSSPSASQHLENGCRRLPQEMSGVSCYTSHKPRVCGQMWLSSPKPNYCKLVAGLRTFQGRIRGKKTQST